MTVTEPPAGSTERDTPRRAQQDGDTRADGRGDAPATEPDAPDRQNGEPGRSGRHEGPEASHERVNRRWNEILQETRVTQTGVQILFGFLLSVAFTPLFRELGSLDRGIYVVTVVLGASATGALIAPVSLHRLLSGQRMKDDLVEAASRLMMCGIVLLALTIGCTLLLILRFVVPGILAEVLVGGVMLWFALCWYALPFALRRRAARRARAEDAKDAEDAEAGRHART